MQISPYRPDPNGLIPLADRPDLTPLLVTWFYKQWGRPGSSITPEKIELGLQMRMNRDQMPITYVYMIEDYLIGSFSLKIREMETHPQYVNWLGSVYVRVEYRRKGIGSWLVREAEAAGYKFGIKQLFLYTYDQEAFYTRMGWRTIEHPQYHHRTVAVMTRELQAQQSSKENT